MQKLLFFVALLLMFSAQLSPALAEKGGKAPGKHKEHPKQDKDKGRNNDAEAHIIIGTSDRVIIEQYLLGDFHKSCPPGLAKKRNGCLPPGQAKKNYVVGGVLTDTPWQPVPQALLAKLKPLPAGYKYVTVDKDILLVAEASHKIIDAVTLLSAVGK